MDRYWFFTWRTYGTWLPGDDGFVGYYRSVTGQPLIDNAPGGDFAPPMPALAAYARGRLKCDPVLLTAGHADELLAQFAETAAYRGWQIDAVAILANHVHLVAGVLGDPNPEKVLGDWKSYGSRRLNRKWRTPAGGWWAVSGSKRPVKGDLQRRAAIAYVRDQEYPFRVWLSAEAAELAVWANPGRQAGGMRARANVPSPGRSLPPA